MSTLILWFTLSACFAPSPEAPPTPPPAPPAEPAPEPEPCKVDDGFLGLLALHGARPRSGWSDGKQRAVVWDGPYAHRLLPDGDDWCWVDLPQTHGPIMAARDEGTEVQVVTPTGVHRLGPGDARWKRVGTLPPRSRIISRRRPGEQTWFLVEGKGYRWEGGAGFAEIALPPNLDRAPVAHQLGEGPLWLGSGTTLHRWHDDRWTSRELPAPIRDIYAVDGGLYVLTQQIEEAQAWWLADGDADPEGLATAPRLSWSSFLPQPRPDGSTAIVALGRDATTTHAYDLTQRRHLFWTLAGANAVGRGQLVVHEGKLLALFNGMSVLSTDGELSLVLPDDPARHPPAEVGEPEAPGDGAGGE